MTLFDLSAIQTVRVSNQISFRFVYTLLEDLKTKSYIFFFSMRINAGHRRATTDAALRNSENKIVMCSAVRFDFFKLLVKLRQIKWLLLLRDLCLKSKQNFLLDTHRSDLHIVFLGNFSFCLDLVVQLIWSCEMLFDGFP